MAIVKKYLAKVIDIRNSIKGVYTLEFESLSKPFKFSPGQFLHLAIDIEYDGSMQWPDSRCFSIQSNPIEKTIKITYAVKGKFTTRMENEIHLGSFILLKLPFGDLFCKSHNKSNTIFISGGTGITPFLSLFNSSSFINYSYPLLYAGFRSKQMNFYQKELELAIRINPQFKIIPIYEDDNGILDIEQIYSSSSESSSFFISGPPAMIKSFKQKLIAKGVLKEQIYTDDWE